MSPRTSLPTLTLVADRMKRSALLAKIRAMSARDAKAALTTLTGRIGSDLSSRWLEFEPSAPRTSSAQLTLAVADVDAATAEIERLTLFAASVAMLESADLTALGAHLHHPSFRAMWHERWRDLASEALRGVTFDPISALALLEAAGEGMRTVRVTLDTAFPDEPDKGGTWGIDLVRMHDDFTPPFEACIQRIVDSGLDDLSLERIENAVDAFAEASRARTMPDLFMRRLRHCDAQDLPLLAVRTAATEDKEMRRGYLAVLAERATDADTLELFVSTLEPYRRSDAALAALGVNTLRRHGSIEEARFNLEQARVHHPHTDLWDQLASELF